MRPPHARKKRPDRCSALKALGASKKNRTPDLREDILAHAWAQCRSNKGAPGVDGQDFADIEAYGVQRWLGELALALKDRTYRPDPIRRVFIPKANGKLRPPDRMIVTPHACDPSAT